jgi:hypothetical protein
LGAGLALAACLGPAGLLAAGGVAGAAAGASTLGGPAGFAGPAQERAQAPLAPSNGASQHFTSRNWDGYITYASTISTDFNVVSAKWVQPVVHCEAAQAWTVFWIGLDGWWDGTVEQGGSSAYCPSAGGKPVYSLWWEMFPTNAIQSVLTTKAGDTITASVTFRPATSVFVITVKDVTTGQHFTKQERCGSGLSCLRTSTDVITEDVGRFGTNGYFPLANYGRMTYTNATATDVAGHSGSISGANWINAAVTEAAGGVTYATVTPLASAGHNFSAIWKHA